MKLILKISATILLLLLISVYGYLQFRESRSYQLQVAKDASMVYKLNVDGLLKTMAADFVGNPGYYLKGNEKVNVRPDFSLPANIFAYSLKKMASSTIFSRVTLSDTTGLYAYLQRTLKIKDFTISTSKDIIINSNAEGRTVGTSSDRKLTVLYNGEAMAIAFSFKREAVLEELNNILDQKDRMGDTAAIMLALKKAKGHLSWTATGYGGEINFQDGLAEIKGSFPIEGLAIPDQPSCTVLFAHNALVKVWVNASIKTAQLPKSLTINEITLSADTLLKSYLGFSAFEMAPAVTQIDSIITYEYNENFEKVATVQLKTVTVPHLKLSIAARTRDLQDYLRENQIIGAVDREAQANAVKTEDRLNKDLFPLYQVFSKEQENIWQLSTLKNDPIKVVSGRNTEDSNTDFFSATADFSGIKAQNMFPLLNDWINPYTHLEITASKLDPKMARLTGKLEFKYQNINAFTQLFR